jgi:hypothetical protein
MKHIVAAGLAMVFAPGIAADARTACAAAPPPAHVYFAWREIGGRRCYYAGGRGLDKSALYWPAAAQPRQAQIPPPATPLPAPDLSFAERWPR